MKKEQIQKEIEHLKILKNEINLEVNKKESFTKSNENNNRLPEIDFFKGLAVICMVIFHYYYLSSVMNVKQYNYNSGILYQIAEFSHNTFIIVSGINMTLSYLKNHQNKKKKSFIVKKFKRGLFLLLIGLIITFLTKIVFPEKYVKFGIFHFIGIATIISSFYTKSSIISLIVTIIIFLFQYLLNNINFKSNFYGFCQNNPFLCFITGIMNLKFNSIDHFSLIPYLGLFSLGITVGHILYNNEKTNNKKINRNFTLLNIFDKLKDYKIVKLINTIGKYSLEIYIIHFLVLYILFKSKRDNQKESIENKQLFDQL